jgi:hypothetical protein
VTQTYEGYWWPADNKAFQAPGRLEVERERITLKLNGRFGAFDLSSADYPIVHGVSGSRPITLRDCFESSSTMSFGGSSIPSQGFSVGSVWLDIHVAEFVVSRIGLQIEHLMSWFQVLPPRTTPPQPPDGVVSAEHIRREPLTAETEVGLFAVKVGHSRERTLESTKLSTVARFDVHLRAPRPYNEADRAAVRPLVNLLTLAATRPTAILELAVEVPPRRACPR